MLVLSGPPGAGKTTIASLLAREWEPSVHLRVDTFFRFVERGFVSPWMPESSAQNRTVMSAVAASAAVYAAGGYRVVVDGVVGPWFLETFLAALGPANVLVHYAVLRPRLEVTLARAQARPAGELTDQEPVRRLHDEFRDIGPYERHVVDNSELTPSSTAELIRRLVDDGGLILTSP